jgi:DNA-binding GntR family transcriptional regulator
VELARRFQVSIVPVREALARLASAGLVEILPHRGVFVVQVSAEELIDIYTVREVLEEQSAKIAVERLTEQDLAALEQLADAMQKSAKNGDFDTLLLQNRALHFTIYRGANRPHMLHVIERMWDLSARYAYLQLRAVPRRASDAMSEVRAIVAGCRRRDSEAVGLMIRYKVHQTTVGLLERMPALAKKAPSAQAPRPQKKQARSSGRKVQRGSR